MTIRIKDKNRAALVKALVNQLNGKIFSVTAKRKKPKEYIVIDKLCVPSDFDFEVGDKFYLGTKKTMSIMEELDSCDQCVYTKHSEEFMTMTCRTGVKKDLKGGESTIKHVDHLISVNLTNGKGYRCFSAYNVLAINGGGAEIKFKESDVLSFEGE